MIRTEPVNLLSRFFAEAGNIFVRLEALVDRLVGDQAIGYFIPGFAGPNHRQRAVQASRQLLQATGHAAGDEPWIPVGVGVHTGIAFVGSVGAEDGATDVTVLGDPPNVAARLASAAAAGEILVSDAAYIPTDQASNPEARLLDLKGKSQPVRVYVLTA